MMTGDELAEEVFDLEDDEALKFWYSVTHTSSPGELRSKYAAIQRDIHGDPDDRIVANLMKIGLVQELIDWINSVADKNTPLTLPAAWQKEINL